MQLETRIAVKVSLWPGLFIHSGNEMMFLTLRRCINAKVCQRI
jgi:hypothetical protein